MIEIPECKTLAEDHDLQAVVVLSVEKDGTVRVSTYGADKEKCDAIGRWGQDLLHTRLSIAPFQTMFGWGNGGVPIGVDVNDLLRLSSNERQYILDNTASAALQAGDLRVLKQVEANDNPRITWTGEQLAAIARLVSHGMVHEDPGSLRPWIVTPKGFDILRQRRT